MARRASARGHARAGSRSRLGFLGAAGTVTGSRFLVEHAGARVLVECGLFQGLKPLRLRNWEPFPLPPGSIDAVLLTHAHLDHSGYLPVLVREGFRGRIWATSPTLALTRILLRDAAHLFEEDAAYANRKGFSKHDPALPLYTREDAERAIRRLRVLEPGAEVEIARGIRATLRHAGHILGACRVEIALAGPAGHRVVVSGDVGRADPPLLADPDPLDAGADTLLLESTYGGQEHAPREQATQLLAAELRRVFERGGMALIPAFAVDRTPALLFALRELTESGALPRVPVFVDSPMALAGLDVYREHRAFLDPEVRSLLDAGQDPFDPGDLRPAPERRDSQAINAVSGPCVVVSASGMATGGRVLHHLARRLPDRRNLLLLVGFQAAGTRGRALADKAPQVKIHGQYVPVRCRVQSVPGFSAHADARELLAWLDTLPGPPGTVFAVHGEPEASRALADSLRERGWNAVCPGLGEWVRLGGA